MHVWAVHHGTRQKPLVGIVLVARVLWTHTDTGTHKHAHTPTYVCTHTRTMHVWAVHHGTREKPARVLRTHTDTGTHKHTPTPTYVCTHTPCTCGLYIMARERSQLGCCGNTQTLHTHTYAHTHHARVGCTSWHEGEATVR